MRRNRCEVAAAALLLAVMLAAPGVASAQGLIPTVIGATIANQRQGGDPCKAMVPYDEWPPERQEVWRTYYGRKIEAFWALTTSDPKSAAKLVRGGKTGGIKGEDGVVRPAGSQAVLDRVTPLTGPFTLVKLTLEGLGQATRGVWRSVDDEGRETLQTVDFKVNFWTMGSDAMVIHRIAITDAEHAPVTPDTMCSMAREAPPLW